MIAQRLLKKDFQKLDVSEKRSRQEKHRIKRAIIKSRRHYKDLAKSPETLALSFGAGLAIAWKGKTEDKSKSNLAHTLLKYSWLFKSVLK